MTRASQSSTDFEGVYPSGDGFGAELQKGTKRLRQDGFRSAAEATAERARWTKSLEEGKGRAPDQPAAKRRTYHGRGGRWRRVACNRQSTVCTTRRLRSGSTSGSRPSATRTSRWQDRIREDLRQQKGVQADKARPCFLKWGKPVTTSKIERLPARHPDRQDESNMEDRRRRGIRDYQPELDDRPAAHQLLTRGSGAY